MEKFIKITVTEKGHQMQAEGLDGYEILGLLLFYEKFCGTDQVTRTMQKSAKVNMSIAEPAPTEAKNEG